MEGEKIHSKWQVNNVRHIQQSDTGDTADLLNTAQLFQTDGTCSPIRLHQFKLLCQTDDAGNPIRLHDF
jgi:hypothetical protein